MVTPSAEPADTTENTPDLTQTQEDSSGSTAETVDVADIVDVGADATTEVFTNIGSTVSTVVPTTGNTQIQTGGHYVSGFSYRKMYAKF